MSTVQITTPHTTPARQRSSRRLAQILARPGWVILTLLSLLTVKFVSDYLAFDPELYFAEQRELYLRREFVLGVHVLCGMLAMIIGPFQFIQRTRRRFVRLHRGLGATYVAAATGLGLSGFVLAPTAYTGIVASLGFTFLDLAMLATTWTALRMVLAHRYADHRRWMIRSYSLIFAAAMLRLLSLIYYTLSGAGLVAFSFETAYAGIAWLCWVPNILLAVWFTRRRTADPAASMS